MFTRTFEPASGAGIPNLRDGRLPVQTWRDLANAVCAYAYAGDGWWAMELPRLATFLVEDSARDTIRVFAEPGASREAIDDLYRRSVVPLFMQALGLEALHASAVKGSRGVVAFCGDRGTGKSTIAYGFARRGFEQQADDTLVLRVDEAGVSTVPVPFTPRLRPPARAFFGRASTADARPALCEPGAEPLDAIFILRRDETRAEPLVTRLTPSAALEALLHHAHCFEPDSPVQRRRLLQNYLDISTQIPIFTVLFAPGLDKLDRLLDTLQHAADLRGVAIVEGASR